MYQLNHLKIPLQAIKNCTNDFNKASLIGKGGYGSVYKGTLSWANHINRPVAVKRLDDIFDQGNKEFYTEITLLSLYRHKNIVTLVGFCDDNQERILVYEYLSRGSLDTYLKDSNMLDQLSWKKCLKICAGIASAICYLHNHVAVGHRIIHRDIKSANILLDDKWNPVLADFGLARIGLANQEQTFLTTQVAGTPGYLDPQYEKTGILTKESDVYSFGVVLFEVLCGRLEYIHKYHDERRFLHHLARKHYKNGQIHEIADHRIRDATTMRDFSQIAYRCLEDSREERPMIAEVASQLREVEEAQSGGTMVEIPKSTWIDKLLDGCYLLVCFIIFSLFVVYVVFIVYCGWLAFHFLGCIADQEYLGCENLKTSQSFVYMKLAFDNIRKASS